MKLKQLGILSLKKGIRISWSNCFKKYTSETKKNNTNYMDDPENKNIFLKSTGSDDEFLKNIVEKEDEVEETGNEKKLTTVKRI